MKRLTNKPAATASAHAGEGLTQGTRWILLAGVFLVSFSMLAFEITLSRLLSILILYHYVFAIVSLALLGLGLGGIFVYLFRPHMPAPEQRFGTLALLASLISLAIPISVILMIQIGYLNSASNSILFYCVLLFFPFFFAGIFLAEVFRTVPEVSARVYGADMVGAALGSLGIIFFLDALGAINTSFFLGATAAVAALLFASQLLKRPSWRTALPIASFIIAVILLITNFFGAYLSDIPIIAKNPNKDIHRALYEKFSPAQIIETRWSAFGRTDLVEYTDFPAQMEIYIDGTATAPMYQFNGNTENPDATLQELKTIFSGYFPFYFLTEEEKDNALIIGPGGGRDVLLTLMGGVGEVTAVEVNRDIVDMVREYGSYNGGIYTDFNNVNVIVDEGRNFLKRQTDKYDIIMLSLPVTQTSRSLEGYSLTENFLFTTESINDYLDHLTDEGRLMVVTHDDFTAWRLLSISMASLEQRGLSNTDALKQIYMLGLSSGEHVYPFFVLKKTPFTPEEALARHEKMVQLGYEPTLAYFPHLDAEGTVNPTLKDLASGALNFNEVKKMAREMGLDFTTVTDNSPFFYKIDVGLPRPVSLVFWLSLVLLLLVLAAPPIYWQLRSSNTRGKPRGRHHKNNTLLQYVFLFVLIGIGFMLIEISLIQRFILYLGQPVLSMAILLFSLLIGAGLGSMYSGRLVRNDIFKGVTTAAIGIAILAILYIFLIPLIFNQLLGLNLALRLLVMVLMLIPLGFLMGFPFPLGIRALKETEMDRYIPWMWGLNGVGSVLGSALTIVIAINLGFSQALLLGAICYIFVFLIFLKYGIIKRVS
jgi:predicted membrane-bound spermidine synthase